MLSTEQLGWIATACGLLALWAGWYVKLRPRWRRFWSRLDAFFDTFNGRPEFVDQTSGRRVPAVLPLGERIGALEQTVKQLANQEQRIARLEQGQVHVKQRVTALETAAYERIATKVEAAQFMRLIGDEQGAAPADPIDPPEGEQ